MFGAQRDKRIETDRTQTTPAQEVTNPQRGIHQGADPTSLPLYTQAWGNLPPPWLRLSVSQQAPQAEGEPLQRIAELTQQPELTQLKENSTALPDTLKTGIEALSGMAMDDVQVHHHSSKPAQVQALAYTQGTDIHVGPGQEQHLAHEAWHVVQQKQGQVRPTLQARGVAINDDEGLENEADVLGAKAQQYGSSMEPVAVMRVSARPASKVIQGKFAVQISLENLDIEDRSVTGEIMTTTHKELRISSVHIADRPPGLLSPNEKSHTTAWALFTDQLRNAILGKTVVAAVQTVHNLYKDAQHLPGVARVGNLSDKAKVVYDNAKQRMDKLLSVTFANLAEERRLDLLQRLGEGFLAYRNAIPLSQVDIGRATGHGEPEVLKNLRPWNDLRQGWEENPQQQGTMRMQASVPKQTREAMWSLLDTGVIESIFMLRATSATAPGVSEEAH